MDITAIQKILSDAVKDYEIAGNVSSETLIAFISVDILRKLSKTQVPSPKAPARQNKP